MRMVMVVAWVLCMLAIAVAVAIETLDEQSLLTGPALRMVAMMALVLRDSQPH